MDNPVSTSGFSLECQEEPTGRDHATTQSEIDPLGDIFHIYLVAQDHAGISPGNGSGGSDSQAAPHGDDVYTLPIKPSFKSSGPRHPDEGIYDNLPAETLGKDDVTGDRDQKKVKFTIDSKEIP